MVDRIDTLHKQALASFDEVLEARLLLAKAKLDATEQDSDRIPLYQEIVNVLKQYEQSAEEMAKATGGSYASVLRIKARRLEAEIQLEQAKAK
jgi:hypothetical protein